MRTLLLVLFAVFATSSSHAAEWTQDYSRLLSKYVTGAGVKYSEWRDNSADRAALNGVIKAINEDKVPTNRDAKLAFYINAYNANILNGVLEKYPIKSIRDIAPLFGFFTQKRISVGGEEMSFNHLEKDIIIPMGEPRIHFALNCASASCPPLRRDAYEGGKLAAQLDEQASAFLNGNPHGVKLSKDGKSAEVSKIFDWNAGDFQKDGGVVDFINKYRKPPLSKDVKVSYQTYDWSLNAAN